VERILADLGIEAGDSQRVIEVWNKIDLLDANAHAHMDDIARRNAEQPPVAVSAATGEGIGDLVALIEARLAGGTIVIDVSVQPDRLQLTDWLYRSGTVLTRKDREDGGLDLKIRTTAARAAEIGARLREDRR
jgi:GTP-binding protein HflX